MEPKFISISDGIIERIKKGELLPGDKVPSENELISTYKISNTTARKCLLEIESKGWARRIKGKGTFVLNRTVEHQLLRTLGSIDSTRKGFDESLRAEGFTPKTVIIEKIILDDGISSNIMGKHYIIEGPVLKIHQLRYADDILMKDETRYISLKLCPKIDRLPSDISFFKVYEDQYKIKITDIKQTLSVDILDPQQEINNFEIDNQIPVFILDGVVLCQSEKVIEIERSYYRGDKYKFAIIANPEYNSSSFFDLDKK
ncbi:GntR family transcriptional regulator [Mucilaginibacter sabulilitoris]|uniref:GntR family transcriptional regulator n=1 Tax=Mucilaginibacter sabulilitoris TaxID=1173583 RepID=A0ABZ0TRG6_9SPHI|nr:GntR family transcriptional regulator [Mucilaginibacter sabulilitoris]WPU95506.1 GntR family transcriptional regulator [Mucilaginibacter sabulilitoris]